MSSSLEDLKRSSSHGYEIKQLQNTIESMRHSVNHLDRKLEAKNQNQFPFGGGVWSANFWAVMGMSLVTVFYLVMWQFGLGDPLGYIRDRVTWSLIKLEQIERGLEPR